MVIDESLSLSRFYENIIEHAGSHILVLDDKFNVVSFNRELYWVFLEAFNVQVKKAAPFFDGFQPPFSDVAEKWKNRCNAALRGMTIEDDEQFRQNGQLVYWKVYYRGIRLGHSKYVSIFARNISVQKMFERHMIQHELNLRTIINSFPTCICFVSTSYAVLDFNDQMEIYFRQRFGMKLFRNRKFIEGFVEGDAEEAMMYRLRMDQVLQTEQEVSYLDYGSANGPGSLCEVKISPVYSNAAIAGLTITVEDITRRTVNRHPQSLHHEELIRLRNELDQFVYSTSHDLRAPLLSIMGVVNLMKKENGNNTYLQHIESSIIKLDNYVTNVVNYSRNSRTDTISEVIDFDQIINDAAEALRYLDGARFVHLNIQLDDKIKFHSDAVRLAMIVKNLISNAFQFYDAHKKPHLIIDIAVDHEYAQITFEDNGIGIKDEIKEHVFDMFFRGTDRSKGAGLGLYIVSNAVQKLQGTIDLRSTPGVGTNITLKIPNLRKATKNPEIEQS